MTSPLLQLKNLVIGYPGAPLSPPLTLAIPAGATVGIIGANGAGKSTLVKTLAGLVKPLSGRFDWKAGTRFGYVPQEDRLSPLFPLTVKDLLKMGLLESLPRLGRSSTDFERKAAAVLEEMDMAHFEDKLVSELSRGQRQRALIARAFIHDPDVLILDEPYSALDDSFRRKLATVFKARKAAQAFSFFIIEHDLNRVINQVDWVIILGPQQTLYGPRTEIITPEALSRAYDVKLHLHEEDNEIQVHFL